jgi:hypothetical protein
MRVGEYVRYTNLSHRSFIKNSVSLHSNGVGPDDDGASVDGATVAIVVAVVVAVAAAGVVVVVVGIAPVAAPIIAALPMALLLVPLSVIIDNNDDDDIDTLADDGIERAATTSAGCGVIALGDGLVKSDIDDDTDGVGVGGITVIVLPIQPHHVLVEGIIHTLQRTRNRHWK